MILPYSGLFQMAEVGEAPTLICVVLLTVMVQQVVTVMQEVPPQVVPQAVHLVTQVVELQALDSQITQLLLVVEEVLGVLGERVLLMVLVVLVV
jgi:hypothetical protein